MSWNDVDELIKAQRVRDQKVISPKQIFHRGDIVRLASRFPSHMSHFPGAGKLAVVCGSYADQFPGHNRDSYTLNIPGHGEVSWYEEELMTMVEKYREDR